ncbi:LOW QUALITY PROTEIN: endothelial cell-specific chemotaxis regulator [Peromyscus californicus insignis]|uniref:LOW QUALITY PROTEIN: endothelial cell-specific chemotaxis regulator n=1 Tax=Peromyscus californicus insignis TaxID=564181 RepID=UPI0022A75052|nr:LOW QUALITY PROTEIN: endothelial cell-specific chemotaxis regulator [Peromyscus californicus insignis]
MDREYTETPPASRPADMGANGAMRLGSAILGLLLLQGYSSQPTTTQTSQGLFRSPSPQPVSLSSGDKSSSGPGSSRLLFSTTTPEILQKASQGSLVSSQPVTPRSSTTDHHSLSLPGLMSFQPQKHTLGLSTGTPDSSSSSSSSSSSTINDTGEEGSLNATPSSGTTSLRTGEEVTVVPSPTSESVLTVAAFGVISFIVILVVVVIVLVSVVSLRFKCRKNKESEDPQKPGSSGLSESCSMANGEKDSITLISMKNINMNNSKGRTSAEKIL